MKWFGRKVERPLLVDDTAHARKVRRDDNAQSSSTEGARDFLAARGKMNGFGDELQVTYQPYTPKPRHA